MLGLCWTVAQATCGRHSSSTVGQRTTFPSPDSHNPFQWTPLALTLSYTIQREHHSVGLNKLDVSASAVFKHSSSTSELPCWKFSFYARGWGRSSKGRMTSPYSGVEDTRGLYLQKSPVTASLWLVPFEGLSTRALDVFPLTVTQCLAQAAPGKDLSLLKVSRVTWQEHHGVGQFPDGGGVQLRILSSDSSRTGSRAKQMVAINLRNSLPLFRNTSCRFRNHPKQRPQLVTKCPNPRSYVGTFHNTPS